MLQPPSPSDGERISIILTSICSGWVRLLLYLIFILALWIIHFAFACVLVMKDTIQLEEPPGYRPRIDMTLCLFMAARAALYMLSIWELYYLVRGMDRQDYVVALRILMRTFGMNSRERLRMRNNLRDALSDM